MLIIIMALAFTGGAMVAFALAPRAEGNFCNFLRRLAGSSSAPDAVERLCERAGKPGGLDGAALVGLRRLSIGVFLMLAPFAAHLLGRTLPMKAMVIVLETVIGLLLPEAWLQGLVSARRAQIQKALPDMLDLLVVSMEAGVGFDAAAAHAAAAMRGPLAGEFARMLQEMRLGRTRAEALRGIAQRADVAEVNGFVAAVTQADRLGSGLAAVLRLQAQTARAARMQRIRAEAARLPTKMLFPLVFFLMPALFVVLLGPGVINLINAMK